MKTDILIVGGGMAGLRLADLLRAAGRDFQLVEARERFGGRILTEKLDGGYFDMGPAWFWPEQPRVLALAERLGLVPFEQYATGMMTAEDAGGQVSHGHGPASMQGSWRLAGGLGALTDGLATGLPADRCHTGAAVGALTRTESGIVATLSDGRTIDAQRAMIALPPRLAAKIAFTPALPDAATAAMAAVPTWMAGQAKAVAVYDTAFWREAGLSGDAMSRAGPMVEIHDASPASGGPFALFGFIGLPPEARADTARLRDAVRVQFGRLFGPQALAPRKLYIKDWAFDRHTATQADGRPLYAHPQYGLPMALRGIWGGRLGFGGTEVATRFGGFIEGALEAAEAAADILAG